MKYETVIQFWFKELTASDWFNGGKELDEKISNRFVAYHQAAAKNELSKWRSTAHGALAEIIILDQFSRNIYRGSAAAFAFDGQALALAQMAVAQKIDQQLDEKERMFIYLPYMHSESMLVHRAAMKLFDDLGNEEAFEYEKRHMNIIDQFGRYPHRNKQLGRVSTPEEEAYLKSTKEAFFAS